MFQPMRFAGDVEQYEDGEAKQCFKKKTGVGEERRGGKREISLKKEKKKAPAGAGACRTSGCESTASCSLAAAAAAAKRQRANEAVDKYLITPTTNTQRAQTDTVRLMVSGCFE